MTLLKRLFLLSILFSISLYTNSQTSVGIYNSTLAVSPSYTVNNGSSISITGLIKNTGNTSITDYLHINIAIDTSTTGISKYYNRSTVTYFVTNFAPSTTHTFVITDVASTANNYFCCGDGTTVIIWPLVGSPTNTLSTHDTATTIIYINTPNGIEEIDNFENTILKLKNPITENILLNYNHAIYSQVELIDVNGQHVSNGIEHDILQTENIGQGLYFLRFYSPYKIVTKKILIE